METRSRLALRRVQPEARGLESHSWEGKRWGKTPGKSHIARGKSTRNMKWKILSGKIWENDLWIYWICVLMRNSPKNGGCRWKILEPNRELTRKSPKKVATIHSEIYNGLGQPQRPHRNLLMVNIFRGQY